jgi:hypothetical protein
MPLRILKLHISIQYEASCEIGGVTLSVTREAFSVNRPLHVHYTGIVFFFISSLYILLIFCEFVLFLVDTY